MRPVRKGSSPFPNGMKQYQDAKRYLIERLGTFCSYCEIRINDFNLHVEHILPKKKFPYWEKTWVNLLLSCTKCNSYKGEKEIKFSKYFLPDSDNTFYVFKYLEDGTVASNEDLNSSLRTMADHTLKFFTINNEWLTRRRMEQWLKIQSTLDRYKMLTEYIDLQSAGIDSIIDAYQDKGLFSIWMTIFKDYPEVKKALIEASPGTKESGCFDDDGNVITPCPNKDNLLNGGKA